MLRRLTVQISNILKKTTRMAEALDLSKQSMAVKRPVEDVQSDDGGDSDTDPVKKKVKQEQVPPMQGRVDRKRKVAMLLAYCGKGYYGIQRNKDFNTIEEELLKALLACKLIPQEHFDCPQKMSFQRAARTDKGVSAVGNVVSLKISRGNREGYLHTKSLLLNQEDLVKNLNDVLPSQIRVVAFKRATKAFNSKNQCGGRTYAYMTPTYAFAPVQKFITEEYRTTGEIITEVNRILALYKGTHNFHNFTSGIKPDDPSAKRYIISFECGEPFVRDGIEFVIMRVRGQSFMLHHIRKMIGLMIAVVKGYCGQESLDKSWQHEKMDIPKAPGLGLMLEQLHYDGYNKKFGKDGMHEAIEWAEYQDFLNKFQEEQIYTHIIQSEKEEKTLMNVVVQRSLGNGSHWDPFHLCTTAFISQWMKWLGTLHFHKFDMKDPEDQEWWHMKRQLNKAQGDKQEEEAKPETESKLPNAETEKELKSNPVPSEESETKCSDTPIDYSVKDSVSTPVPSEESETKCSDTPIDYSVKDSVSASSSTVDTANR